VAVLAVLVIALSACGASSEADAPPATAPASAAASDPSASSPSVAASSADDCDGATARVTAAVASFAEVTKVTMIAACSEASIETSLPAGALGSASADTGVKICQAAAMTAYSGDVNSITVDSIDGHELAIGLKNADCIP
jgi:hypothetical protein